MEGTANGAIAIVGLGAVLPDAPNVTAFWTNIKNGRYSVSEVPRERWDPADYYDPDPSVPDKTYSKIGGWVRDFPWEPVAWRLPIPPRVAAAMDDAQKWAIGCTRAALEDYGYPKRALDSDRTAVILGNALAGEKQYLTVLRAYFPEYAHVLESSTTFATLPGDVRGRLTRELRECVGAHFPEITEDTMPGELANCIAGRVANLFNFHGPNYVVDAACASAMAAMGSAAEALIEHKFDVAITGGVDRNMGPSTFIKFCKIGALSPTGSRPYAEGADGFIMGEGSVVMILKRLADAERHGDRIYAVLRGIGGASDGKGKGITAPNPIGQKLAVERAWRNAGLSPATAGLIEGHGTSTRVGDVVEVQSMLDVLAEFKLPAGSVALGSVKSNIGHLKAAAGAAGVLKTVLALHEKVLPPSVNCERTNSAIDFAHSPLYVNRELRPWDPPRNDDVRRAGASAFGFGGTNFHMVFEEYVAGRLNGNGKRSISVTVPDGPSSGKTVPDAHYNHTAQSPRKVPLRGALVVGAYSHAALAERLRAVGKQAEAGHAPAPHPPHESDLRAPVRLAIDYADAADLADKSAKALKALAGSNPAIWKALRAKGIFRGEGPAAKVAFLYTGQGSQYVNMLQPLRSHEPIVAETFAEADRVLTQLLGKPLTQFIFVDNTDAAALAKAEEDLRQTAITQPAVLSVDIALTHLLAAYGIQPDFTMGHSLGEYGALVAAGAIEFGDALEAVSARGREMTRVSLNDNGRMAAIFAPLDEIERLLKTVSGYLVIANINSEHQAVIGGASDAVQNAVEVFQKAGRHVALLPVSHAFHTSIVAPASDALRQVLLRMRLQAPRVPAIANVTGDFYPAGATAVEIADMLARQVASPVQFVKGLRTLHGAGARVFVECGPKRALQGFVDDVFGEADQVLSLSTNHPKNDLIAFNHALCGLYASGLGRGHVEPAITVSSRRNNEEGVMDHENVPGQASVEPVRKSRNGHRYEALGRMFADALERGWQMLHQDHPADPAEPVVITGAALGLPGAEHVFDDANVARILRGEQFIDAIPAALRQAMLDKNVTRLVKSDHGEPRFESIHDEAEVIKLAGRARLFDLEQEFGVPAERIAALDRTTQLAIASGIDALRDAGIPLVMRYKTTTKGTKLPDRWLLPESMRADTGIVFASAFPGYDRFADDMSRYYVDRSRRRELATLEQLRSAMANGGAAQELDRRIGELKSAESSSPYVFDRRFLFRILAMGHSQFAEYIGARGPNTQVNAACASTTQAIGIAEDWIRAGRARRVFVISADDVTSDHLLEWIGAGFLASGAAATDEEVQDAAIPFDRRRHGMLIGMGAAALVVESATAARERGIAPICDVLGVIVANSAHHGTRLDINHIGDMMERLISRAESQYGIRREEIAPRTVFVSHETYTPARGGSASAEIFALRRVFGELADRVVIANTKGFTGHPMGTGIEDVVAVKTLETGCVPPVANFKEVDPELGALNLSKGGSYPVQYALRLAAGFGSQICMSLLRWVPTGDGIRRTPESLGYGYRIADREAWQRWTSQISGSTTPQFEVVHRTLRVHDERQPATKLEMKHEPAAIAVEAKPSPAAVTAPARMPLSVPATGAVEVHAIAPTTVITPTPVQTIADAAPAKAAALPPPPATSNVDPLVQQQVLVIVSQKTGYPVEMLDLDLDLEADLGVDTVKQAEIFASVRERYGIPRDDQLKLRDFPTLSHVIRFVHERRPELRAGGTRTAAPVQTAEAPARPPLAPVSVSMTTAQTISPPQPMAPEGDDSVRDRVLALVVEKTGYPKEMLDLDLDLEADLGIDTVKQAEMFAAIRATYNISPDDSRKLRDYPTLTHVIRFVYEKRPDLAKVTAVAPTAPVAPTPQTPVTLVADIDISSAAPQVQPAPPSEDEIRRTVLAIVADQTGYPQEMLDLDLDLEADLGIDTVKQAEMFAAVRVAYGIPRDDKMKLRDFPTLAHVIRFACERRPAAAPAAAAATPRPSAPSAMPVETNLQPTATVQATPRPQLASFEAADLIPRRVPVAIPRPPLELCKHTGVTLGRGSRVVLMADRAGVGLMLTERLAALGVEVLPLSYSSEPETIAKELKAWIAKGAIQGVYWLPALDDEGDLRQFDGATCHDALFRRVKAMFTTMQVLYDQIAKSGTFLVTATRMGGQHGYDDAGATAPLGGAVTGFTKTYKRERLNALVKAVDFETGCSPEDIADRLIEETLRDPGAVEIGHKHGQRWTVGLKEMPANDGRRGMTLNKDTVFVVTGAAGSIVSAITADLAAASGGTFYLLDLVPEPDPSNPDLKRTDRDALKLELFSRIQARGERATPAVVERELAALERAQAALHAIEAIRAAGGTAHYFSVNLTDPASVDTVIDHVRRCSGRVDVLLHAAGIEHSHFIPDKQPREFDLVFDVKAAGWFNLLHAIGDMPLGATVAFSSIAARFGNPGQTDYASANDLLCKVTSSFRRMRPQMRAIAIDWTAWGGIGMATRGSIPKMLEQAGIDMLPPEAGVPLIRRELTCGGTCGEVLIGQRLGMLSQEFDPDCGLDSAVMHAHGELLGPMIGNIKGPSLDGNVAVDVTLDPKLQPFLHDHQIEGTPVLPGVMGIEGFAEIAACLFPGWRVAAIEDVNFLSPVKFFHSAPRTLRFEAVCHGEHDTIIAECRLVGQRTLPGQMEPQSTLHFTGRVSLARNSILPVAPIRAAAGDERVLDARDIYRAYFHGPAYQVLEQAWRSENRVIGQMSTTLPANHQPAGRPLLAAPRLIELCFQTAGLWEMGVEGRMGLPRHIDCVSILRPQQEGNQRFFATVTPRPEQPSYDADVVDSEGNIYLRMCGYRTVELPNALTNAMREPVLHAMESCEVCPI